MISIKSIIKTLLILSTIFNISCTNTRLVLEGTKKIIQKKQKDTNEESQKSENSSITLGHYKVGNPYVIGGIKYTPKLVSVYDETGIASWYGPKFHLKKTANGEIFDQDMVSAAHKTLPLPSIVKVTSNSNNRIIYLRVNDRGPFVNDRIIDFSKMAAIKFNFFRKGTSKVRVQLIDSGPHLLEKKYLNHSFLTNYAKSLEINKNIDSMKTNKFLLQLGVFKDKTNALNLLNFLKSKISDNLYIENHNKENNDLIYKVFVGPFYKEENAKTTANKLLKLGFKSIFKKE